MPRLTSTRHYWLLLDKAQAVDNVALESKTPKPPINRSCFNGIWLMLSLIQKDTLNTRASKPIFLAGSKSRFSQHPSKHPSHVRTTRKEHLIAHLVLEIWCHCMSTTLLPGFKFWCALCLLAMSMFTVRIRSGRSEAKRWYFDLLDPIRERVGVGQGTDSQSQGQFWTLKRF